MPEGCGNTEYCPQGVTPDGKYIAGYASSITEGMYVPVIWTLQDDGSYTAEVIAHPTEDLMGLKPQMAILYGISNDGTRAYGILRDFTGFYSLGVIYKKDANGAWTYQTVGQDWLVKDESKKPGAYPVYEDYVTAEAGTPEWYEQDANYAYAIMDWNAALNEYVYTGTSPSQQILVNQNSISGNGKYMVMSTPNEARRYNTEDGTFIALPGTSGQVTTGITNNGDVLMASPIGSPYRTASYCPNSEAMDGTTGLMTWLNNNYAVQYAEGTDGTQGLGTCCTTPDGQTIVGWNNPQSLGMYYVSTVVQLGVGKPVGIDNVTSSTQEPTIENGVLYIPEGEASVSVYATNGSQMASFTATGSVDLSGYNTGLTIVKVKTGKLTQTFKVTL